MNTIFITGASSGIGKATAKLFAQKGWDVIATMRNPEKESELTEYKWPDYSGLKVTVQDSCDYRNMPYIHQAVRNLLCKMNVEIEESKYSRENSMCCGVAFRGILPQEEVEKKMQMRVRQLPDENVVNYCMGCETVIHDAGRTTYHLLDLMFDTVGQESHITMNEQARRISEYKMTH